MLTELLSSIVPEVFCKKGIPKNVFMTFITFKTRDKTCLEIETAWFLLVHWVPENSILILLCHFHKEIFEENMVISKKRSFFDRTLWLFGFFR